MTMAYLAIVLGMGIVTYLPRWLPLMVLTRMPLPRWLIGWLEFIPVAILSALLMPALLMDRATGGADLLRPELWIAVPTFIFAFKTRSLGATVAVGMGLHWLAGKVWG